MNIDINTILEVGAQIIAAASIIANKTKTDKDDKAIGFISKIINFLSLNFFRVKKTKPRSYNSKSSY